MDRGASMYVYKVPAARVEKLNKLNIAKEPVSAFRPQHIDSLNRACVQDKHMITIKVISEAKYLSLNGSSYIHG